MKISVTHSAGDLSSTIEVDSVGPLDAERTIEMLKRAVSSGHVPQEERLPSIRSVEIAQRKDGSGALGVEAIDYDGGIELAIFSGPNAEKRAGAYAMFQYPDIMKVSR